MCPHGTARALHKEGMRIGTIMIDEDLCKGCALCVEACPLRLIRRASHFNPKGYHPAKLVDPQGRCTGCALCALICPDVAIKVYREEKE